jgi:hypothetical protein
MFDVQRSKLTIRFWQWPNVLAIDAALIALLWQAVFAFASNQNATFASASVLGLSVWLTYIADRLFDVAKRPMDRLQSLRHRFTKRHPQLLWKLWLGALAVNICMAFTGLTTDQLLRGSILLAFCLLYTGLNQKLSDRFFPKELCVAIIYAAGVIVLLPSTKDLWIPASFLMLLCLINCLIISANERQIDAAMKTRSIAQFLPRLPFALYLCCIIMLGLLERPWLLPFGSSLAALILVHFCRKRLSIESFRILADGALLVGPLLTVLFASA